MKYALIGCGRIAPNHIEASRKNALELVALCDINREHIENLINAYDIDKNIKTYTDYRELVLNNELDLVAVATESGSHFEIAAFCIEHNINVIIEKPISLKMEDARKIVSLAKEHNVKVCACHQNRFNIAIQQTRKALEEGRFGRLSHGAITVRWGRNIDYYKQDDWRGTWAKDGGALMNQCIHGFDLLRWMFGDEIDEVYAVTTRNFHPYIEAEDLGMAVVKFKNGATATLEGTTNIYDDKIETETLCIYGEKGAVEVGGVAANKMQLWSFSDKREDDDKNRGLSEEAMNVYGFGHISIYADVIDAVKNDRQPYVDAEAGLRALELILAVYKSSLTGKPVKLPLDDFKTTDMVGFFGK